MGLDLLSSPIYPKAFYISFILVPEHRELEIIIWEFKELTNIAALTYRITASEWSLSHTF